VSELERQNEELRRVIRHMRRDIETLSSQVPAYAAARVPSSAAPDGQNQSASASNGLRFTFVINSALYMVLLTYLLTYLCLHYYQHFRPSTDEVSTWQQVKLSPMYVTLSQICM